jgi:hypothetical protein
MLVLSVTNGRLTGCPTSNQPPNFYETAKRNYNLTLEGFYGLVSALVLLQFSFWLRRDKNQGRGPW